MSKFRSHLESYLNDSIIKNVTVFNGPCDIYGQVVVEEKGTLREVYPEATCYSDISQSKVDLNGKKSTLRKAWILKTCLHISKDDEANKRVNEQEITKFANDYFSYDKDRKSFLNDNNLANVKSSELILKLCTAEQWQRL